MPPQITCLLALMVAACGKGDGNASENSSESAPPPMVSVLRLAAEPVPNVIELPGRVEAVRTAEVRARVDGIVERRFYEEGSDVRAGAVLFQIDPRDKRAALQQTMASLKQALAVQANNDKVVRRYAPLVSRRAVSQQEYDAAVSELQQSSAQVAQARASVDRARLELGYTRVTAPIAGRAGRAQVTEGALVSASSATLMATVDQLAPIYANFSQSNAAVLDLVTRIRSGALKIPRLGAIAVRLTLENGAPYPLRGRLNFADLTVDPQTGGQSLRAVFPNPDRVLLPGQFVRGAIEAGIVPAGIKVPQRAVQISDKQATLMMVDGKGTVASRTVELGALTGSDWVIRSGVKAGETVVVDGWQNVQPGQKVRARPAGAKPPAQNGPQRDAAGGR